MLEQKQDGELSLTPDRLGAGLPARDRTDADVEKRSQGGLELVHGFTSESQFVAILLAGHDDPA